MGLDAAAWQLLEAFCFGVAEPHCEESSLAMRLLAEGYLVRLGGKLRFTNKAARVFAGELRALVEERASWRYQPRRYCSPAPGMG